MSVEAPPEKLIDGRYDTAEELGRGGWGVVVRATDHQLGRDVAIKRVHGEFASNDAICDRFCHEARVTATLQHPGIAPVHELGVGEDGSPYYVMKLLGGPTLRDAIHNLHAKESRSVTGYSIELLERFIDICNTVAYAHKHEIIHRDLKPSNVLVSEFGETIVVDWGLAKHLGETAKRPTADAIMATMAPGSGASSPPSRRSNATTRRTSAAGAETRHGAILGTPAYMSPEQSRGDNDTLTPATDIFALGVMLYEMITGENPFRTDSVETTISRVQGGEYQPPRLINKRIPKQLEAICIKAMAHRPEDRYPDAEAIVQDLRNFSAGEPVSVCRDTLGAKLDRWRRRRPGLAAGVLGSASVLLVASIAFGVVIHRAHQAERAARIEAEQARQEAMDLLTEAREAGDAWLIDLSGSLEYFPGMEGLRTNLLKQSLQHYRGLVAHFDTGTPLPPVESIEAVRCQIRVGDLNRLLGDDASAIEAYRGAEQLSDQALSALPPGTGVRDDLMLQRINAQIGQLLLGKTLDLSEGEDWLKAHSEQVDSALWHDVANTAARLAIAQSRAAAAPAPEIIERLQDAEEGAAKLATTRGEPKDLHLLQTLRGELTVQLRGVGRLRDASKVWSAEITRLNDVIADQPTRPDLLQARAFARMRAAGLDARMRRHDAATTGYQQAIDDLREAWRLSDADAYYHRNVAISLANLGQTTDDPDTAGDRLNEALAELKQAANLSGPTASDLERLAACEAALGRLAARRGDPHTQSHFDSADQCYALLSDHNELTSARALGRAETLLAHADYLIGVGDLFSAVVDLDRAEETLNVSVEDSELSDTERRLGRLLGARLAGLRAEQLRTDNDIAGAEGARQSQLKELVALAEEEKQGGAGDSFPIAMQTLVDALVESLGADKKQVTQAAAWLAEMRRLFPSCAGMNEWQSRSALVQWRLGNHSLAANALHQAQAIDDDDPLMNILQLSLAGRANEASQSASDYLAKWPGDRRFRFWAGLINGPDSLPSSPILSGKAEAE